MVFTDYSLTDYYSSNAFLAFAIGNTLYSCITFSSYAIYLENSDFATTALAMATLTVLLRIISVILLWLIWIAKPNKNDAALTDASTSCLRLWLPEMQAIYPVAISGSLAFRLIAQIMMGDCNQEGVSDPLSSFCSPYFDHGGISLRLVVELMFNPILTAFLLRDTLWEALFGAWVVAVAILVAFCALVGSVDVIIATVAYVYCSVLLYLDCDRHGQQLTEVLTQLQRAQQEIDRLAKEAQAIELRAMIGNVAHDLKTPLTSFLNGVECTLEVIASWEVSPARSPAPAAGVATFSSISSSASQSQAQAQARTRSNLHAMRKCLLGMKSTTSFMTMTINRCLDYTKTNAGLKLTPKLETVYLKSLLDMPIKMMQDAQNKREIVLHPLSSGDICSHVITDKQWLLENLLCLLSNAVKYSLRGKVEVSVQLDPPTAEGNLFLRFMVLDAGIGLSDEAMQTLFNPFKQAQRLAGGTGLGLFSLAKRVEALQGTYGVARRPDGLQGSLFWFTIPYRPDVSSAALNSHRSVDSSTQISLSDESSKDPLSRMEIAVPNLLRSSLVDLGQRRYHVLVVDDASLIVKMTTMLLTRKGHTVRTAVNGAEGLDVIISGYEKIREDNNSLGEGEGSVKMSDISGHGGEAKGCSLSSCTNGGHNGKCNGSKASTPLPVGTAPFDVVLMDLQMPIMDGPSAIQRLRVVEERFRREHEEDQQRAAQPLQPPQPSQQASTFTLTPNVHFSVPPSAGIAEMKESEIADIEMGVVSILAPPPALSLEAPAAASDALSARLFHQFVIAVSANADQETVDDALRAGADLFMTKPFSYDTFQEMMEKAGK